MTSVASPSLPVERKEYVCHNFPRRSKNACEICGLAMKNRKLLFYILLLIIVTSGSLLTYRLVPQKKAPEPKSFFVGAKICKKCHPAEYDDWERSPHAHAVETLRKEGEADNPECLECHTSFPTGKVQPAALASNPVLGDVKCEVCHQPGSLHFLRTETGNIRRTPPRALCERCHTEKWTPDFDDKFDDYWAKVDHRHKYKQIETTPADLITKSLQRNNRLKLDIFVMSHCPFGIRTLNSYLPYLRNWSEFIDWKVHYIAYRADDPAAEAFFSLQHIEKEDLSGKVSAGAGTNDEGVFKSLHGQAEVKEDIYQLVLQYFFPKDKYIDYVLCRNQNLQDDPEKCAEIAGIDWEKVTQLAQTEGEVLLQASSDEAMRFEARVSPTMFIDGEKLESIPWSYIFARRVCEHFGWDEKRCGQIPKCKHYDDCTEPGQIGRCFHADTNRAYCESYEPILVKLTVVNDADCPTCNTYDVISRLMVRLLDVKVEQVERESRRGKRLIEECQIEQLPAYLLDSDFQKHPLYDDLPFHMEPVGDYVQLQAGLLDSPYLFSRKEIPHRIDLFVNPFALKSMVPVKNLLTYLLTTNEKVDLHLHYRMPVQEARVPGAREEALRQIAIADAYPDSLLLYLSCFVNNLVSNPGMKWFDWQKCWTKPMAKLDLGDTKALEMRYADRFTADQELMEAIGIESVPTVLLNNRLYFENLRLKELMQTYRQLSTPAIAQ